MTALPLPCLMLVTEPSRHLPEIVAAAVASGVDIVQWRDKGPASETFDIAWRLREITDGHCLMVINGQPNYSPYMVRKVSADGVHQPEDSRYSVEICRAVVGGGLVGRSVHSVDAACEAAAQGADYLIAGTIFDSQSHPGIAPAGLGFLRDVCAAVSVPVLAIGGVTPQNLELCLEAGAVGVAVLSPIMRATDPKTVAQEYRAALDTAWKEKQ